MSDNASRAPASRLFTARHAAVGLVALTAAAGIAFAAVPDRSASLPPQAGALLAPAAGSQALAAVRASRGGIHLGARLDRSQIMHGGDGIVRAELTLSADASEAGSEAVPSDFVVVIDRSSSMSGEKFADAMRAVQGLLGRLRPADRLAVVSYSSAAQVDIHLQHATEEAVARWRTDLGWMRAGGSTNISAALDLADSIVLQRDASERPARVLLLSDGEPTAGDTHRDSLVGRARRAARQGYVLGSVGIGLGFNELLMAALADAGTGNFHSLHAEGGLEGILAAEFDAARGTVASGLAVTLDPAEGVTVIDAAGYPLERIGQRVTFRPGGLFAGQQRRIWVTLQVPAGAPDASRALGAVGLTFARGGRTEAIPPVALGTVSTTADEARFVAALDKQTWEKSVVDGRFADIEKQLGALVRRGEADAARALLDQHSQHTTALNRVVGSAAVDAHLVEVAQRRKALDDAFTGADQAHKRNLFSKSNMASGWTRSRAGSLGGR